MQWSTLRQFYQGKSVLITGHTGFKGAWLSSVLLELGAVVTGFALQEEEDSLFAGLSLSKKLQHIVGDIREQDTLQKVIELHKPEVIFHLAAQSLVSRGYQEPKYTLETNIMGTVNLLESCTSMTNTAIVVVTSDKCYRPSARPCVESDPLGGLEPYSASKAATEIIVESYQNIAPSLLVATARGGNSIGAGDRSASRLFPDIRRALQNQQVLYLRHPQAKRPWQFVLEPLWGYLILGKKLLTGGARGAWNFGPADAVSVQQVVDLCQKLSRNQLKIDVQSSSMVENQELLLCSQKAEKYLRWSCQLSWQECLTWTWEDEVRLESIEPYTVIVDRIEAYSHRWE